MKNILFVFFIIIYSISAQTHVGGIINLNTTWAKANSPYTLDSNVQIDVNAEVTVEAGVTIIGNSKQIEIWGKFTAIGTNNERILFQNVVVRSGSSNTQCIIYLDYVEFQGGGPSLYTDGSSTGQLILTNSYLSKTQILYIKQNAYECFIEKNIFFDCAPIDIRFAKTKISIRNNTFYNRVGNSIQVVFLLFQLDIVIEKNSFFCKGKYAISFTSGSPFYPSDISNNYWNTVSDSEIDVMIWDHKDDLGISSTLNYKPILTSQDINTPAILKLTSFNNSESIKANTIQTITWQSWIITKIKLEYATSSTNPIWKTIVNSISGDAHSYQWTVPNDQSNDCILKISNADDAQMVYTNSSTFSITAPSSCTLTVTSTNGTVTKNPDQANYNYGTSVTLTATPSAGYLFVNWTGDATGSTNPLTLTMNGNKSITANFARDTFTVTLSANPKSGGTVTGDGTYDFNSTVTVVATAKNIPGSKFLFTNWTENGNEVSKSGSYSFAITGDRNLVANFQDITSVEIGNGIPKSYTLLQNYPNPFNSSTNIQFSIPKESFVLLKVYDVLGNEIETLVNQNLPSGTYDMNFDASKLNNGVYFYRLQADGFVQTRKMILLK